MKSKFLLLLATFSISTAMASSDNCYDDAQSLYYQRPSLDNCTIDLPFLDPFNDSRENVSLLLRAYLGELETKDKESGFEAELEAAKADGLTISTSIPSTPYMVDEYSPVFGTCHSNDKASAKLFIRAVRATTLSNESKSKLSNLRISLLGVCGLAEDFRKWVESQGSEFKSLETEQAAAEWFQYLEAAYLLYRPDAKQAALIFEKLRNSTSPWLKETSLYLHGRTLLIQSQWAWDGYSISAETIERESLEAGKNILAEYVEKYPNGRFTLSARGLIRRAERLGQDESKFVSLLFQAFHEAVESKNIPHLILLNDELEKFYSLWLDSPRYEVPLLAAESLLYSERHPLNENDGIVKLKGLETQQAAFSAYPGLYNFLHARTLFHLRRFEQASASPRFETGTPQDIQTAHLALVAEALESLGKYDEAEIVWRKLIAQKAAKNPEPRLEAKSQQQSCINEGDCEATHGENARILFEDSEVRFRIALFRNLLRSQKFEQIAEFGIEQLPGLAHAFSQVYSDDALRNVLSNKKASNETKQAATNALLYHSLLDEKFRDFAELYDRSDAATKARFARIEATIHALAKERRNPRALLDFGHYQENFYGQEEQYNLHFKPVELGNSEVPSNPASILTEFFGKPGFRGADGAVKDLQPFRFYQEARELLLKLPNAAPDLQAEALYRLIWCFRWSSCSAYVPEKSVPKKQRAAWFSELRSKYKNTTWAKETKYYY